VELWRGIVTKIVTKGCLGALLMNLPPPNDRPLCDRASRAALKSIVELRHLKLSLIEPPNEASR
jgi:hypothetical protein